MQARSFIVMGREIETDVLGYVAPLRQVKLSEQIYARIFGLLAGDEFAEQSKLPTENELAVRFNVSRTIVREALARLRDDGIVVSRQGTGTFVKRKPDNAALKFAPIASIADMQRCFEFREGFEANMAFVAAARAPDEGIVRIENALATQDETERDEAAGTDVGFDFHLAIAEATGNRFFVAVLVSLRPHIVFGMRLARSFSLPSPGGRSKSVQVEHHAIFDAIKRRDPYGAGEAMRRHIENAKHRMFEGQAATDKFD
jgi:GntR family transcriptional repressor for pyruvate dehydrogenase complex